MPELRTTASYRPTGDQPRAIDELAASLAAGNRYQALLGATATGKTPRRPKAAGGSDYNAASK